MGDRPRWSGIGLFQRGPTRLKCTRCGKVSVILDNANSAEVENFKCPCRVKESLWLSYRSR